MSDEESYEEPRSLLHLSAEQITGYSVETVGEWLLQRNEQRRVRLAAACRALREQCALRERAHARLIAALTAAT